MQTDIPAVIRVCCPRCGAYSGDTGGSPGYTIGRKTITSGSGWNGWNRRDCHNNRCQCRFEWRLVDGRVESKETAT